MKYCIGPMSRNVVDTIINFSNNYNIKIGLIPSRRQIEFNGGYSNNWTTYEFSKYVKSKSKNIFLQRDHGGPKQGAKDDDGFTSFAVDSLTLDSIHIDPWKYTKDLTEGINKTVEYIDFCLSINKNIKFEVGTEESIRRFSNEDLDQLLKTLENKLIDKFETILYVVIQGGTALKENTNTGNFDEQRLSDMIQICKKYNKLTKEHNGDYITQDCKNRKFNFGLDCINIAPEFGLIETKTIMQYINEYEFETFFNICYTSKKWEKWVSADFDPYKNKKTLIEICGHYVLSNHIVNSWIENKHLHAIIYKNIEGKLKELYGIK